MTPIFYQWTDEGVMKPLPRFAKAAEKLFYIGETYRLEILEERSRETHNHFFACIHEAWINLPEHLAERFPTSTHLRKWCLIKAGYRDERTFVAKSAAQAVELAAFIRPIDDFALVTVNDCVVSVFTAKSQSVRAMGRKTFQGSKEKVLGILAEMIGTELQNLIDQARGKHGPMRKAKEVA